MLKNPRYPEKFVRDLNKHLVEKKGIDEVSDVMILEWLKILKRRESTYLIAHYKYGLSFNDIGIIDNISWQAVQYICSVSLTRIADKLEGRPPKRHGDKRTKNSKLHGIEALDLSKLTPQYVACLDCLTSIRNIIKDPQLANLLIMNDIHTVSQLYRTPDIKLRRLLSVKSYYYDIVESSKKEFELALSI